jgi:hypothetical protein
MSHLIDMFDSRGHWLQSRVNIHMSLMMDTSGTKGHTTTNEKEIRHNHRAEYTALFVVRTVKLPAPRGAH